MEVSRLYARPSLEITDDLNSFHFLFASASKWLLRQNAIKVITSFVGSGEMDGKSDNVSRNSSSILTVVKEHTRGFKETNVNILKAIIQLFMTMIEYHEAKEVALSDWVVHDGVTLAVQKLSDRKLSSACKVLLAEMCVVSAPALVLAEVSQSLEGARSPLAHEEALKWFHTFCDDFGAGSLGHGLSSTVLWVIDVSDLALCFSDVAPLYLY